MDALPRISVVIPSFRHGPYLEVALRSVLDQDYPALECIVIDGGSDDGSVDILRRYESRLAHWESAPDRGQSHALNKGFGLATGEVMAWLNADDFLLPGALRSAGRIFSEYPTVEWITSLHRVILNASGEIVDSFPADGYGRRGWMKGRHVWFHPRFKSTVPSEGTFWRRALWDRAGAHVDERYRVTMDYELWSRFFCHANCYGVTAPLGAIRALPTQRSVVEGPTRGTEELGWIFGSRLKAHASNTARTRFARRLTRWKRTLIAAESSGVRKPFRFLAERVPTVSYDHVQQRWVLGERFID